jgi:hypothetical protein
MAKPCSRLPPSLRAGQQLDDVTSRPFSSRKMPELRADEASARMKTFLPAFPADS